jgi:hypothetical protein
MILASSLLHAAMLLAAPAVIDLLFDRKNDILLLPFPEKLTRLNFERADAAVTRFVAQQGQVDTIIDFRDVSEDVDTTVIIARAHVPSPLQDRRRVFVVSGNLMAGIFRMYAIYHKAAGFKAPKIVRSLEKALSVLEASEAKFEPLVLDRATQAEADRPTATAAAGKRAQSRPRPGRCRTIRYRGSRIP